MSHTTGAGASTTTGAGGRGPKGRRRRSPVFVDRAEVKDVLGIGENRTLARWVRDGLCPPPDRWLTPLRPVWLRKGFEAWLGKGRGGDQSPPGPAIQPSDDTSSNAR